MGKVKQILTSIERNKNKIAKFLIICAFLQFFCTTFYRIYSNTASRTLVETMINIYALLIVGCIFLHEFMRCFLCRSLVDNMKIMTHHMGQGITFILISFIYMSHTLGAQQNYSAYLLFFVGVLLIAADCKFTVDLLDEEKNPFQDSPKKSVQIAEMNTVTDSNTEEQPQHIKLEVSTPKSTSNPYDIPDDF